jgi:hypothetical protein
MKRISPLIALSLLAACSKSEPETVKTVIVPFHWMVVTIAFLAMSAITRFDRMAIQAVRQGDVPPGTPLPPNWIGFLYYVQWGLLIALAVFDWKFAILVFVFKTVLSFLGLLNIVGALLMAPFMRERK